MPYSLYWAEEQLDTAAEEYGTVHGLKEDLESVLEEKERQLLSVDNPAQVPSRFHNAFTMDELRIAEIAFAVHGKDFRAICVVLDEERAVFYHILVDKNNQERVLRRMRKNSDRIRKSFREKLG